MPVDNLREARARDGRSARGLWAVRMAAGRTGAMTGSRRTCFYGSPMADVSVTLSSDEALVLFEVLHRWQETGAYERADLLPGEGVALWALSCCLETVLVEPFDAAYDDLVDQARQRLMGDGDA